MSKFFFYLNSSFVLGLGGALAQPAGLPEIADARVSIPYAELKNLWRAAQPKPLAEKLQPPVASALLSAHYQVAWQPELAEVVAEFETQSYTEEWNCLPLLGGEAQIASVEPADTQIIRRDGSYNLVTHAAGKTKIKLSFSQKFTGSEEAAQLRLVTVAAFINLLTVSGIPENHNAQVEGATPLGSDKGTARFRLAATDHLEIRMVAAKISEPPVPSPWKIDAQAFVRSDEGKLVYQTRLIAHAETGSGLEMDLTVPATANIVQVKSADLADWRSLTTEDKSRRVHLRWQTRDILNRELEMNYELPQPPVPGEWKLITPQVEGGEMATILYAISGEEGMELTPATNLAATGRLPRWLAERVGPRKLAVVGKDGLLTTKYLPLVATNPATIETAKATMQVVADGSLLNEMVYFIHAEAPLAWQLQMPSGSELLSCSVNHRQVSPVDRGKGLLELAIDPTDQKSLSEVRLSYTSRKPAFQPVSGQVKVELPQTALLIRQIEWELNIPAAYEIAAMEGNVESAKGGGQVEGGIRVIRLHKELCKAETPAAELFYQKSETNK